MKHLEKVAAGAAIVGGVIVFFKYEQLQTGDARLDRAGIRGRALYWGLRLRVPPHYLMAIAREESAAWLNPQLGDQGDSRGPSVGPLQVLRTTAIAEGYVGPETSYDDYSAFGDPSHEGLTFEWGARLFAKLLAKHAGDAAAALAEYNGSQTYAQNALAWLASTFPDFNAV